MTTPTSRHPWGHALLWLAIAAPGFFLFYGQANAYAATLPADAVGNIAFAWERALIPFWPWTIIPYWSIDLMYGVSILIGTTRLEIRTQACRLLLATALSSLCFVLWPLRFGWDRPEVAGLFGQLFAALGLFDKPFNQAPSLHIGLLFIIWLRFAAHLPARWLPLLHLWCVLIGLSVLTTWQHHVLDIPTGVAMGVLVCWLLPMPPAGWRHWRSADAGRARQLAGRYLLGAATFAALALILQGWAWLLLWPAAALLVVALAYTGLGPQVFQKVEGRLRIAASWLTAPYRWGAVITRGYFLRRLPGAEEIVPGLWVGPITAARETRFAAVLDLTAEYPRLAHADCAYRQYPLLDLLAPAPHELREAASLLDALVQAHPGQPVLVHCALGLSRSSAVAAAWLLQRGLAHDAAAACASIRARRPHSRFSPQVQSRLALLAGEARA
ncbi:phosphatase PAP2/dual specificity phosphatase family protein [Chitinilyticum litopenaei]|uniref:phosphatase PAP2/dual specificity phosphatase family protein n=1 Tax=Chitinilyticum litopenaei TaxID=1121276 RepID=UPI000426B323|nr:phosphatase PAP2/dual specificity phosphatase family protein [Chitinilyticum litopenaei]